MASDKKYIRDHFVLLLVSINAFLAIAGIIYSLIKIFSVAHSGYIVQYRPSLGVSAYQTGSSSDLVAFSVFAVLILAIGIVLSYRAYKIHRQLAVTVLTLGIMLLSLNIIISNALLQLR
ncbi:MAG TPA: hypothetical protein VL989_00150 [Candidatus Sulfotelmatobacter sp.]|nr:hypothetical protein [Candidatus Sulfotelmatobacter sp.]